MVQAGELRHRIEIQDKTNTRLSSGGIDTGWTTIQTRWAKKEESIVGSEEQDDAEQVVARREVTWTIREMDKLNESMRIKDKQTKNIFSIKAIARDNTNNREVEIMTILENSDTGDQ